MQKHSGKRTLVQNQIHGKTCVDVYGYYTDVAPCGKPSFRKTHGWLCLEHYRDQQTRIPVKPKKRPAPFKSFQHASDEEVVRSIIETEKNAIANSYHSRVSYGRKDPAVFRTLISGKDLPENLD